MLALLAVGSADLPAQETESGRVSGSQTPEVEPIEIPLDEIVVTVSHTILGDEPISTIGLGREEIRKLPHFGDDLFRAITVLPGISANDFSAAFNVRGGFNREILARIDGLEVYEPFHLKDFQGSFSILDPNITAAVDLTPGGYSVEFGDRMSGVLDMTTTDPTELRTTFGVSFSNIWAGSAGTFAEGKGRWVGSARRGFLDLVLKLSGAGQDEGDSNDEDPAPRYWDLFAKVDYDLTPAHTVGLKVLAANDTLDFEEQEDDEFFEADTAYGNQYLWATHNGLLSSRAFVDTVIAAGNIDRDRNALFTEESPSDFFVVSDQRDTEVLSLRQDWNYQLSDRQHWKWGFEIRSWSADYDYVDEADLSDPINDPRFLPGNRQTEFEDSVSSSQYALYAADRFRTISRLTVELGARWDRIGLTDEDEISPRVNLVYDFKSGGVLRAGWGLFYQSQRPYELQVQFGETKFQKSERAEHWILGYETDIGFKYRVRADAFRRSIADPQIRYETLFDPFNSFPEARIDLIEIPAQSARSHGLEVSLRARQSNQLSWWVSYGWSLVGDRVQERDVKRSIDQTHSLIASANWQLWKKWSLTWVWLYHTGWPTTAVAAELANRPTGELFIDYTVGPFYSERLDDYHRLDFRASRSSKLGPGLLTLFLDIRNLYNRSNPRGIAIVDPEFVDQPDGSIDVLFPREEWLPILPSFGISYEF
jgi:hypothetical protein